MAKAKPSIVEQAKQLRRASSGTKKWRDRLAPDHLKQYDEVVEWYRQQPEESRPNVKDILTLIKAELGTAPCSNVFRDHVLGR
jgi:hypothetical protein